MLCKFPKIDFEILVVIQSPQDGIDVAFCDVFVEFDHESIQLIKINEAKISQIKVRKAGNCVEIGLTLKLFFFFFDFYVIVQLFFYKP